MPTHLLVNLRRGVTVTVVFFVLLGLAYPLAETGIGQALFSHQANGSMSKNGSTLIGQNWSDAACPGHPAGSCVFQGRPDDLGPYAADPKLGAAGGDNPLVANGVRGGSGATNLGPRSKVLVEDTKKLIAYWKARGVTPTADLVTTSGSGYDPDITPADALAEVPMVAKATGLAPSALRQLIARETHGPQLGFLGSSYLDVLQLNEALAQLR
ncbi:potassium-transporting ATPase subunit C [Acidiferrimicrobium sp. IK]|uniref:potassium-transporting ATPase subunit C n=1 Tax=Acidiferrimicrobium sp. IK TaxID=2871700 RepID=UPI0021CB2819|nr:potassium-transporting ATPase subunit C [Acidiferrimicrobium sp. IK]MCU4182996.1 potassium-transporting ATPase subunit C [Acidiferrimicrobium sp. IK]